MESLQLPKLRIQQNKNNCSGALDEDRLFSIISNLSEALPPSGLPKLASLDFTKMS